MIRDPSEPIKGIPNASRRKLRVQHCDHSGPGWGADHVHEWQWVLCRWRQPRLQVGAKLQNSDALGVTCAIDISTMHLSHGRWQFLLQRIWWWRAKVCLQAEYEMEQGRKRMSGFHICSFSRPYSSSSSSSSLPPTTPSLSDPHWCWLQWVYNWKPSQWADCRGGRHIGGDFLANLGESTQKLTESHLKSILKE